MEEQIIVHPKYEILGNSNKFNIVTGGRGSGKSFSITYLITYLSYEAGHVILYTRYTLRSAHISIIPEFVEKIELLGRTSDFTITKDSIINNVSGSKILFRGIKTSSGDQTANLKSIQGLSTWVMDEAEELQDEDKYDTINLSVRSEKVQNRVILIMNPATKEHWIYKRFFESKGVEPGINDSIDNVNYIHTTYIDNKEHLSNEFINDVEKLKENNPAKYQHKILGGWLDKAEGVVFENWQYGKFNPENLQTSFGMDFGFSVDPDTLIEVAINRAKKIIYVKQHIYKRGLQLEPLAKLVLSKANKKLIIADSAEPRLISDLKSKGLNIRPVKKGTIESGVTMLLDYRIIVEENSTDIGKELNNYTYLDKGSKMYVDDYNHSIDAIRYNVVYQLDNPNKGKYFVY